jgi:hypothetical protein
MPLSRCKLRPRKLTGAITGCHEALLSFILAGFSNCLEHNLAELVIIFTDGKVVTLENAL